MVTGLCVARSAFAGVAQEFDGSALSGEDAVAVEAELGAIRRLTDAMLAKAVRRVENTGAFARHGDRSGATHCAGALG